jgi:hypothetical protein
MVGWDERSEPHQKRVETADISRKDAKPRRRKGEKRCGQVKTYQVGPDVRFPFLFRFGQAGRPNGAAIHPAQGNALATVNPTLVFNGPTGQRFSRRTVGPLGRQTRLAFPRSPGRCPMLLTLFGSQFCRPLPLSVAFVFGLGVVGSWEVSAGTGVDQMFCDAFE